MVHHPAQRRAFSLIELLIVIVIMGIIGTLALPMFGSQQATKLRSAADLIAADLVFAQIQSISHSGDPRVLVINAANDGYLIAQLSTPSAPVEDPVTNLPYLVKFGQGRAATLDGVTISAHGFGADKRLGFGAYGQLDQATDATLTLAATGCTLTLTIKSSSGEVVIGNIVDVP